MRQKFYTDEERREFDTFEQFIQWKLLTVWEDQELINRRLIERIARLEDQIRYLSWHTTY